MSTSQPGYYVSNNELTSNAAMTTDLIKKCTFHVGSVVPVRINREEQGQKKASGPEMQYYNRFIDVTYPNGDKSATMVIPNVVMHHEIHDYFGTPSIYVGVPQTWVKELQLKLSTTGSSPLFEDKKVLSTAQYWWIRVSRGPAEQDKEYIRIPDNPEDPAYYGSFAELFADYPTSMVADLTCTLKLKSETEKNNSLTGNEVWRAGIQISMFTPFDEITVDAPSTGIVQRSAISKNRTLKAGLAKKKMPST